MKIVLSSIYPDVPGDGSIIKEAWDTISQMDLKKLIDNKRDRCQAVIDARGRYPKLQPESLSTSVSPYTTLAREMLTCTPICGNVRPHKS
jgi:hypothetical protein